MLIHNLAAWSWLETDGSGRVGSWGRPAPGAQQRQLNHSWPRRRQTKGLPVPNHLLKLSPKRKMPDALHPAFLGCREQIGVGLGEGTPRRDNALLIV